MSFSDKEKLLVMLDVLRIAQGKFRLFADACTLKCSLVDYWISLDISVCFPWCWVLETMEAGHDISDLVSHGLDVLSNLLLPSSLSCQIRWAVEILCLTWLTYPVLGNTFMLLWFLVRDFISQMTKQLVTSGHTSLLFLIKVTSASVYMLLSDSWEVHVYLEVLFLNQNVHEHLIAFII